LVLERARWGLFAIAVVAVIAVVFATRSGENPHAGAATEAALRIESDQTARFRQPTTVRVYLRGGAATDGYVRLWVPADYLQKVELQEVDPKPEFMEAAPDRLVYVFRLADPHRPATFSFTFLPSEVGPLAGRIGLLSGEEVDFKQVIYP